MRRPAVAARASAMSARRVAVALCLALIAYLALVGYRGVILLGQPGVLAPALGGSLLLFPVIGAWAVLVEVRFGIATERLARQLDGEGAADELPLPRTASGRVEGAAARALFDRRRDAVQADPLDWRGWYRLAVAYDLSGDRKRARMAMRTAISRADPAA